MDTGTAVASVPPADPMGHLQQLLNDRKYRRGRLFLARELSGRALCGRDLSPAEYRAVCHFRAEFTYRDRHLPVRARLRDAFSLLGEALRPGEALSVAELDAAIAGCDDARTLTLAGDIEERRWRLDHHLHRLSQSLVFYRRARVVGAGDDAAWVAAARAAHVLDQLASEVPCEDGAWAAWRAEARVLREEIVAALRGQRRARNDQRLASALAEALFGLGEFRAGADALSEAKLADGQRQVMLRRLARIAVLHELASRKAAEGRGETPGPEASRLDSLRSFASREESLAPWFAETGSGAALEALAGLTGGHDARLRSLFRGRVGLALSGGGFRASLFHIGVLARLADRDLLRHVEVISAVSGGSIIAAHYYLKLRALLERTPDEQLGREHYVALVREVLDEFLAGVQRNIRMRIYADPRASLRAAFSGQYSISHRLGELYERELFARVDDHPGGGKVQPRMMNELFITPHGWSPEVPFKPNHDNWERRNKVPMLLINAATLNTGHSWQFTASWMGEPAEFIDLDTDANDRLRRAEYVYAPEEHRAVRLGYAVAASSSVPGVFRPMSLAKLYAERTVRLVDGGVHDNQGASSLLEQDCTVLLVSDASGQISTERDPDVGTLAVLRRSDEIVQARVREAQYRKLLAMQDAGRLNGLMYVHLKADLPSATVDWQDSLDPELRPSPGDPKELNAGEDRPPHSLTRYGVRVDVQRALAEVRTDLDTFSDVEAFALMMSGYQMTEHYLREARSGVRTDVTGADGKEPEPTPWRFRAVEPYLGAREETGEFVRFLHLLHTGSMTLGKWVTVSERSQRMARLLGLALVAIVALTALGFSDVAVVPTLNVGALVFAVGVALAWWSVARLKNLPDPVPWWRRQLLAVQRLAGGVVSVVFGLAAAVVTATFLGSFEQLYLRAGRLPLKPMKKRG